MRPLLLLGVALIAGLAATGCADADGGGETAPSGDPYVVERASANGVETVRTVSGSRWGGHATLLEELSIGEEIGQELFADGDTVLARLPTRWAPCD